MATCDNFVPTQSQAVADPPQTTTVPAATGASSNYIMVTSTVPAQPTGYTPQPPGPTGYTVQPPPPSGYPAQPPPPAAYIPQQPPQQRNSGYHASGIR